MSSHNVILSLLKAQIAFSLSSLFSCFCTSLLYDFLLLSVYDWLLVLESLSFSKKQPPAVKPM